MDYENNQDWKFNGELPEIIDFYSDWCGTFIRNFSFTGSIPVMITYFIFRFLIYFFLNFLMHKLHHQF
jgi:hypothetical protein